MKNKIDDGFSAKLVETAMFEGVLEIPQIKREEQIIIPKGMVPYSQRDKGNISQDFVNFYEHDIKFADVLLSTEQHLDDLKRFPGIITPDCSLYWDMPLCLQIANVYMNRAVGCYLQEQGIYVIPNVRWGDERTYTTIVLPEKVAFLGIPKHSIVSVGTYGCVDTKEEKACFRAGLIAMLEELAPYVVLVYGAMPECIFADLMNCTRFIQYKDWTTQQHGER